MQKAKSYGTKKPLWHNCFWVADYKPDLKFFKLIWRIHDLGQKFEKLSDYVEYLYTYSYLYLYTKADYDFDL